LLKDWKSRSVWEIERLLGDLPDLPSDVGELDSMAAVLNGNGDLRWVGKIISNLSTYYNTWFGRTS